MAFKNGTRLPVTMQQVFPQGCHLMPDSITEAQDYDEKTRIRTPAVDKLTGKRVFQCRVADMDPELEGRSRETVVKILADRPPSRRPGSRSSWSSSTGLQVTPYVDSGRCQGQGRCNARMAFSLRATGIKAARPAASRDAA